SLAEIISLISLQSPGNKNPSLPKPSISMIPAGEVTWGQDVDITCLISLHTQQLLNGTFILNQTSGSVREKQTSNNTATFRIMNFDNKGAYQCQYQTQISSRDFSSPLSDSIRLSVNGKEKYIKYINKKTHYHTCKYAVTSTQI
uniref:Ig-like domain-containing protein n=1 Tax=Dicentrarchus labrax TaxID=13489 RepID=A0A8P4K9R1_DICLA